MLATSLILAVPAVVALNEKSLGREAMR